MDDYLQMQQDSVACRVRAKRGCATHPRSIAERVSQFPILFLAIVRSTYFIKQAFAKMIIVSTYANMQWCQCNFDMDVKTEISFVFVVYRTFRKEEQGLARG